MVDEQLVVVLLDGVVVRARWGKSVYWTSDWSRIYELKASGYVTERWYGRGIWRDNEFFLTEKALAHII